MYPSLAASINDFAQFDRATIDYFRFSAHAHTGYGDVLREFENGLTGILGTVADLRLA